MEYDTVFKNAEECNEKRIEAYQYYEDHFKIVSDIEKLEYDAYLTLLYQCFCYFDQDDANLGLLDYGNYTKDDLETVNDIYANELCANTVNGFLDNADTFVSDTPVGFILENTDWLSSLSSVPEWIGDSAGELANILTFSEAALEAAKFVNLSALNEENMAALEYLAASATHPVLMQAAADLHESALAGTRQFIANQKLAYAAREVLSDAALSAGLSVVRKAAYGMASSAAAAGGAAATAGALPILSTFGVQLTTGWMNIPGSGSSRSGG